MGAGPAGRSQPLKRALRRAERRRRLGAVGLVLPLLLYILAFFLLPIGNMLALAVANPELRAVLPETAALVRTGDAGEVPDEPVFAALAREMRAAQQARTLAAVARRLAQTDPAYRSLVTNTGRTLPETPPAEGWRAHFLAADPRWGDSVFWSAFRRAAAPFTDQYLLAAVDLERDRSGEIRAAPPASAIYRDILARTFTISLVVTLACLALGYPLAYRLATLPPRTSNLLMILVLLPFWTSLLVRTGAWVVLLQREGLVNGALLWLGLTSRPLELIYNRVGVYVAMTHILLPFMVLPLYSVMRAIPPVYLRAARSLGAPPVTAFRRVYLPQTLPGIGAGCLLVFILALGYYITPALVGGAGDQMISWFVAFFTLQTINWGMAAALGVVLLTATLILYLVYARLVGIDRLRLG